MTIAKAPDSIGEFGRRLRLARESRGMSQTDLANRMSMQPSAVSHFETGGRAPSFASLIALADALRVSADYLLGRTDDFAMTRDRRTLDPNYSRLTAEQRDVVDCLIEALSRRAKS